MKKTRTRTIIFSLLLMASISSYAYLNLAPLKYQGSTEISFEQPLFEEIENTKIAMPHVRIIKKATELGRRILPGS